MKKVIFLFLMTILCSNIKAQNYKVGDKIMAFENDDALWYEATVIEVITNKCKIHWEGFSTDYDEFMSYDNMWKQGQPFLYGDKIQGLETDGKWYNVKILKVDRETNQYFIHWGGFDAEYDRWIGYDSLRLPTKANKIEAGSFNTTSNSNNSSTSNTSSKYKSSYIERFVLENRSGATLKYEYDTGGGAYSSGSLSNGGTTSCNNAFIGGKLKINGSLYKVLEASDHGKTITIK